MTREPIVLHVARDDYQGTLCGEGRLLLRSSLATLDGVEAMARVFKCDVCDRCREAAQEGER